MNVAVLVVGYEDPVTLSECLASVQTLSAELVLIVDNSRDPSTLNQVVQRYSNSLSKMVHLWMGGNIGLPGAIGAGFEYLAQNKEIDAVLVLDDDTLITASCLSSMIKKLAEAESAGAVTVATEDSGRFAVGDGEILCFPWSPTLIAQQAISHTGRPRQNYYFTYDDWEFSLRMRTYGYRLLVEECKLPRQSLHRYWQGRAYYGARNLLHLILTHRPLHVHFYRNIIRMAVRALYPNRVGRLILIGFVHAIMGRMGRYESAHE